MNKTSSRLIELSRTLCRTVDKLSFGGPVEWVYNPLDYARAGHEEYLERFADSEKDIVLLGMNPGPFGMAQTGVPFGEVKLVSSWMKISAEIKKPKKECPARPITGFDCQRSEVSGARLWGAIAKKHPNPEDFFRRHFVLNYCPLVFMAKAGTNVTPDKLPKEERAPLEEACDAHLRAVLDVLSPTWVLGVGAWAEKRAKLCAPKDARVGSIPHPSPASPKANAGWDNIAREALMHLQISPFL